MVSLGHQSLPPTDLGRVDEKMASPDRWIPRGVSFQRPRHRLIAVASLGRLPRNRSIRVWFTRYPRTAFYTRAFGDGPSNFEPWSSDVDELAPPSPNYHTTPTGGRYSSRQI
ncbi:hypothetical protein TNCV_4715481 [Trichonephila clavipes]|nr:hypothetical protein TNCV_4715481 [Trichonephila clavipes]